MFFTLIIPAYNCQETIDRLLISIINQHYDDLKVIVIDDSDKDRLCQNYINKYKDKLNIEYHIRRNDLYTCHCPGNTRHDGLRYAFQEDTEYIFFADCDDEFFPNSFKNIHNVLIKTNYPDVLITPFQQYSEEMNKIINSSQKFGGWLHGKFYKKSFLLKNNIQFEVDLQSHEDVFFNSLIGIYSICSQKTNFLTCNKIIYKWYERNNSTSHLMEPIFSIKKTFYLERHFKDWIKAVFSPIQKGYILFPQQYQIFIESIIKGLILGYFYIQLFIYYNHDEKLCQKNYQLYKKKLIKIINNFNLSKQKIILLAYKDPQYYTFTETEVKNSIGFFIEEQSFKDFINSINIYE